MNRVSGFIIAVGFFLSSCSYGQLTIICDTPSELKEISAVEYDATNDLYWVIQDSGNSNKLIAITPLGKISHKVELNDTKNKDWEDLTTDKKGNIYIGDFGNNDKSRNKYKIYRVNVSDLKTKKTDPELIEFKLPKGSKEKDFESFFLWNGYFYLFSKADKKTHLYRVPNKKGEQTAKDLATHEFEGKHSKVTSAAISPNGKTVVLLNGDKLWKLTKFDGDNFFSGTIEYLEFNHKSQKEGVGFITNKTVVISDERNGINGGNLYQFQLN